MIFKLNSSPHQHVTRTTADVMRMVMYAAIPGVLCQIWFFGYGVLIHFVIAGITAVAVEASILELRKRDFESAIKDSSALLTALLIAISIPPLAPWWISFLGSLFAIAIVKQLYGGLGQNPFNPAMAAYVMLLVSFPVQMTSWLAPADLLELSHSFFDAFYIVFTGFSVDGYDLLQLRASIDGTTMATPLDHVKTQLAANMTLQEATNHAIMASGLGKGWVWINLCYLAGGLYLLKTRVINWHIPFSMLGAMLVLASIFYLADADMYGSPLFHILSGGFMFGAFFIATDPVSAATTNMGRLIYGALIAFWIYVIRVWGGYPDAIAFAVLLTNMTVPLIDYYTRPRTYGHNKGSGNR